MADRAVLYVALLMLASGGTTVAAEGPWDLGTLQSEPKVQWVVREGPVRSLYYEGERFHGKPTQVFAYFAVPEHRSGRLPGLVLVHGGGGRAYPQWATMWAQRGYAAIAMDLSGNGPGGRPLPDGGPPENDQSIFYEASPIQDAWVYHSVAAVIRAVSFLTHQPEVDPERIGITGISWGGFLTDIVAGLDQRLKVAIPVYGCGFIYKDSVWATIFKNFSPGRRRAWIENFDPSKYLPQAKMPMLWIAGTNDFAYPLDSLQESYRLPKGPHWLRVTVRMPHGHQEGWEPVEIYIMADQVLKGGVPLPRVESEERLGNQVKVKFWSQLPISQAALNYTTDGSNWIDRAWKTATAEVNGSEVTAALPDTTPVTYFISITDARGAVVSSEHEQLLPEDTTGSQR